MQMEFMKSRFLYAKACESNNQWQIGNLLTDKDTRLDKAILDYLLLQREPFLRFDLIREIGNDAFQHLIDNRIIIPYKWDSHDLDMIEIETSTVCNWKCRFCPTTSDWRYPRFMSMELFENIVKKMADEKPSSSVAIHFYNEPTLDPLFLKRVEIVKKYGLQLSLYTNGTGLDSAKLSDLSQIGILKSLVINIPSIDRERFQFLTAGGNYDKTVQVLETAIHMHLPVQVSVHGKNEVACLLKKMNMTKDYLASFRTVDRAGILQNEYCDHIYLDSPYLFGCILIMKRMYVDIDGFCIICCQDYYKEYRYAHISDGPLSLIYGKKLSQLRKVVCGGEPAGKDFICRKCRIMDDMRINSLFRLL